MNALNTALTNMRRSPYQTLVALLIVSITFFVGYSFSLFIYGTEQILRYFETRPQAIAFFEIDAPEEQVRQAEETMRSKPYVTQVEIISKDDALTIYQENNQGDPLLLELVTADILPASIEVSGTDLAALNKIRDDLEELPSIDDVAFQQDIIESLSAATTKIRLFGVGSISILGFTSLLIIAVVTSLKIANKRRAIQIMRIIGATSWYIKAPFLLEGILYGVFGSLIGWSIMYGGLLYLTPWMKDFLGTVPLLPLPGEVLAIQVGAGTLFGMLLGALASTAAVQRVMRV